MLAYAIAQGHVIGAIRFSVFMAQILQEGAEAPGSHSDSGCVERAQTEIRELPQKTGCNQDTGPGQRTLGAQKVITPSRKEIPSRRSPKDICDILMFYVL